jgi:F420-dependent methylenetetrahydromethanopterin dehydrogenase
MSETNMNPAPSGSSQASCSADFVMPFGKYRGQTLDQISDNDTGYILWLADENVLRIEREFLDAVRMDDMEAESEMRDIINEHVYDIY